jgi:hypothetical protein
MKSLIVVAVGLLLLAGCSTNRNNSGGSADTAEGISGGVTGTPSGTSQDPLGSGGGGVNTTGKAPADGSTTRP